MGLNKYVLIAAQFCCTAIVHAQQNGDLIGKSAVQLPEYSTVKGIDFYYTQPEYDETLHDTSFHIQKLQYWSDNLKVVAYMASPKKAAGKKLPVIIFNRGSYIRNDIAYMHAPLFRKYTKAGYIVIAPALRGSEGGEGTDEMGGNDVDDIMNIYPLLLQMGNVDTSRVFMYGESRGGMMTFLALAKKFPVKAAATVGAFTDMQMFNDDNPYIINVSHQIWKDYDEHKDSIIYKRSVVNWADLINVPVLVMQGGADPQVRPFESLKLVNIFQQKQKTYQYIILQNGNHILSHEWTDERDRQILNWFERYSK